MAALDPRVMRPHNTRGSNWRDELICLTPQIVYAPGPESVTRAWLALQRALPALDRRFGFFYWWDQRRLRLEVRATMGCMPCRRQAGRATNGLFETAIPVSGHTFGLT